jgi:hypothetical protein
MCKRKWYILALGICGALFVMAQHIDAAVPQNIGFKDVKFDQLSKPVCVECHGDDLVGTHHETKNAVSGNCVFCHQVATSGDNVGVTLSRNCMTCHVKSPHHETEAAKNKACTSCHGSEGVADYSEQGPLYTASPVTPTVASCKKCHSEGKVGGVSVASIKDTHHGIATALGCKVCHEKQKSAEMSIRQCERCHSVEAIHNVKPHVEPKNCAMCHLKTISSAAGAK